MLRDIRTAKNKHAPANRLPPEVLSRVLEHRSCESDLVAATHVCPSWRSTLTTTPYLWTRIRFGYRNDIDRILTYLERSKPETIDVSITANIFYNLEGLKHFAPHISRTRSFVIQGGHGVHDASSLLLCRPTPSLEHLEIHAREGPARGHDNFLGRQALSLRSMAFKGAFPVLGSSFPLPNLAELHLRLTRDAHPFHISSFSRFLSSCPKLQKLNIDISDALFHDATFGHALSLESLEELHYKCSACDQLLPLLDLPRLKLLRGSLLQNAFHTSQPGSVCELANHLPYNGQELVAGATQMFYISNECSQMLKLSGEDVDMSITASRPAHSPINWFSDETYIPFGQITDLKVEIHAITEDLSFGRFKNLTRFQMISSTGCTDRILRLLYPDPGAGIPCPSLQKIRCASRQPWAPLVKSLIGLAKKREQVGCRLGLVCVAVAEKVGQNFEGELRRHVGELRVGVHRERD